MLYISSKEIKKRKLEESLKDIGILSLGTGQSLTFRNF